MAKPGCPKNITNAPCNRAEIDFDNIPDGTYYTTDITVSDKQITDINSNYNPNNPSLNIGGVSNSFGLNIMGTLNDDNSVALGHESSARLNSVAVGKDADAWDYSVDVGTQSNTQNDSVNIGHGATSTIETVNIGSGATSNASNQVNVGYKSICKGANSTVVGAESEIDALTPKDNQVLIGAESFIGSSGFDINQGNVVVGYGCRSQTGGVNGSSQPNTLVGYNCEATDGSSNTIIGQNCQSDGIGNGNILIGNSITTADANGELRIGGSSQISRAYIDSLGNNTGGNPVFYDSTTKELYENTSAPSSGGIEMASGTFTTGASPETVNITGVGFEPTMIQLISIPTNKLYSDKFQCNGYWKDGDYSMAYSLYGNSPIAYYERTTSYVVYCGTGGGGVDLTGWISGTNSDGFDVEFGLLPVSITFIWYAYG